MLTVLLLCIGVIYLLISFLPAIEVLIWLVLLIMICLGMGNGAVFQLVPQRFPREIGVASGLVGAFGGIGGFFLPTLLGSVKQLSGSYSVGLVVLAVIACIALVALRVLVVLQQGWRFTPASVPESKAA
jgi:NNP family nitrate/nitrite transporter-like MFS transporter